MTEREQLRLFGAVATYRKQHNIAGLVEQLAPVCNTPAKRQILTQLRRLLPEREHGAFDKLLAVHRIAPPPQTSSTARSRPGSAGSGRSAPSSRSAATAAAVDRGTSSLRQTPQSPTDRVQPVADPRQPRSRVPRVKPTKIVLHPDTDGALGFDIRGGKEHGLGIFVSLVEEGSQAQKNGLVAGQLILKTNGISFENISHEKAVEVRTSAYAAGSTATQNRHQKLKMIRSVAIFTPSYEARSLHELPLVTWWRRRYCLPVSL